MPIDPKIASEIQTYRVGSSGHLSRNNPVLASNHLRLLIGARLYTALFSRLNPAGIDVKNLMTRVCSLDGL